MDTLQKVFDDYKGLNLNVKNYVETINHIDDDICDNLHPWTILMSACLHNHINIVKRCIRFGADPNKLDHYDNPPLYLVLQSHRYCNCGLDIAKILLKAGADPNIKIKCDNNYYVPIIFLEFYKKNVELLLKYGALTNEFYKYKQFIKEILVPETCDYFKKVLSKRRWVKVKCIVLTLALHKRAVERVNHPDRLLRQGYFQLEI